MEIMIMNPFPFPLTYGTLMFHVFTCINSFLYVIFESSHCRYVRRACVFADLIHKILILVDE